LAVDVVEAAARRGGLVTDAVAGDNGDGLADRRLGEGESVARAAA